MNRFVLASTLISTSCAARSVGPSAAPEPSPVSSTSPYGDLLAHEVMKGAPAMNVDEDATLREEGIRALDEGRYEDAREIFGELLERDAEDEALDGLYRRADALANDAAERQHWRVGVPECDEYLEHYLRCIDLLPEAAREATREAVSNTAAAWREVADGPQRDVLGEACAIARDAARKATEALGCEW